jgi:hypothetical protein
LHALDRKEATPNSAEDAGRYASSQVAAGMAAAAAGRQADADGYFSTARRVLEPLAPKSRYWRVLDPWARLALLSGNVTETERVRTQLSGYGYVPLFAWSASDATDASRKTRAAAKHAASGPPPRRLDAAAKPAGADPLPRRP